MFNSFLTAVISQFNDDVLNVEPIKINNVAHPMLMSHTLLSGYPGFESRAADRLS